MRDDRQPHVHADRPGIEFSWKELLHLGASVLVLSAAFSFALTAQSVLFGGDVDWFALLDILPWSTVIVFTAFVLHELAHKVVAQWKHMWAEFRASPGGLLMALAVSAATGIVFAAPGAVYILGHATEKDSGVISIVGPMVNLAIGFIAVPFAFGGGEAIGAGGVGNLWEVVAFVNLFLAGFNMIPVLPLDGAKVWRWSKLAYVGVIALIVLLAVLIFGY